MDNYFASVITHKDEMTIEFFYKEKKRTFVRPKEGELMKTLKRISLKLGPQIKKKNKAENTAFKISNDQVNVFVFDSDSNLCDDQKSNIDSFQEGCCMQIISQKYVIQLNPPTVVKLLLPECIMAGFPVYPQLKLFSAFVNKSNFTWYKSLNIKEDWEIIGEDFSYIPNNKDIMFHLKCICRPGNYMKYGPFLEEVVSSPVLPGPGICIFENRHLYTQRYLESNDKLRIVTYNILADVFCGTDVASEKLYPYCPKYALKLGYRMNLLIKEIVGFNADILCLQECELKMFEIYLKPVLQMHNYDGYLNLKTGEMPEGEALFIKSNKFTHLKDVSISVKDALYLECNKSILAAIEKSEIFYSLCKKSTIAQIHIVAEKGNNGRQLCLFNTHLYYKSGAQVIRILQMAILVNYVKKVLKEHETRCFLIMCGDYNSKQGDPLLLYLYKKPFSLKSSYGFDIDYEFCCPFKLTNVTGFPLFTVFVQQFKETLDYIFVDENFSLDAFVPIPLAEELEVYTALPSVVSPSDHLPLVVDLNWK